MKLTYTHKLILKSKVKALLAERQTVRNLTKYFRSKYKYDQYDTLNQVIRLNIILHIYGNWQNLTRILKYNTAYIVTGKT